MGTENTYLKKGSLCSRMKKVFVYLFENQSSEEKRRDTEKREIFPLLVISLMATRQLTHPRLPHAYRGPGTLGLSSTAFPRPLAGDWKCSNWESASRWAANAAGGGFTTYATTPTPRVSDLIKL